MTLRDLREYPYIKLEVERISKRLNELKRSDTDVAEIKKLNETLENLYKKQYAKETELTEQLLLIKDTQVRLMVQLHYIDGLTWNEVANKIGGNNTEDSCRMCVQRYIKSCSICSL